MVPPVYVENLLKHISRQLKEADADFGSNNSAASSEQQLRCERYLNINHNSKSKASLSHCSRNSLDNDINIKRRVECGRIANQTKRPEQGRAQRPNDLFRVFAPSVFKDQGLSISSTPSRLQMLGNKKSWSNSTASKRRHTSDHEEAIQLLKSSDIAEEVKKRLIDLETSYTMSKIPSTSTRSRGRGKNDRVSLGQVDGAGDSPPESVFSRSSTSSSNSSSDHSLSARNPGRRRKDPNKNVINQASKNDKRKSKIERELKIDMVDDPDEKMEGPQEGANAFKYEPIVGLVPPVSLPEGSKTVSGCKSPNFVRQGRRLAVPLATKKAKSGKGSVTKPSPRGHTKARIDKLKTLAAQLGKNIEPQIGADAF
ncbi:MAG: hypothetical protein MMC23_000716 [Stictis urceolatum]|nr:hypothetical protein [Stictis urceolata]